MPQTKEDWNRAAAVRTRRSTPLTTCLRQKRIETPWHFSSSASVNDCWRHASDKRGLKLPDGRIRTYNHHWVDDMPQTKEDWNSSSWIGVVSIRCWRHASDKRGLKLSISLKQKHGPPLTTCLRQKRIETFIFERTFFGKCTLTTCLRQKRIETHVTWCYSGSVSSWRHASDKRGLKLAVISIPYLRIQVDDMPQTKEDWNDITWKSYSRQSKLTTCLRQKRIETPVALSVTFVVMLVDDMPQTKEDWNELVEHFFGSNFKLTTCLRQKRIETRFWEPPQPSTCVDDMPQTKEDWNSNV